MATVKIHEGTKHETPLDLQNDEGVIFVCPAKNLVKRNVSQGCFKGNKQWIANLVITNKRVITIPQPPNKKNYQVESFYWKDITSAKTISAQQASEAASLAKFSISMKQGQTSSCSEGGEFWVCYAVTLKNFLNIAKASHAETSAENAAIMGAQFAAFDRGHFTDKSIEKYYANMAQQAKDRAANMDFSKADHNQIRDYIVNVINDCVAEAAKG